MRPPHHSLVVLALIGCLAVASAETRTFIDQAGRALEGELLSVSGTMVAIKRSSDGQTFNLPATAFSQTDQAYFVGKGGTPALATPAPTSAPATGTLSSSASTAPFRIELKVYPNKNDKPKGGYYDDRVQRISYKINLRNGEQKRSFDGGKVIVLAVAKNLQDSDESQLIIKEEFPVSLAALATQTLETGETKLSYDNIYYKYGYKYSGYVCVLKDSSDKTVTINGSAPAMERAVDDLLKFKVGDVFDKNYKPVRNSVIRNF